MDKYDQFGRPVWPEPELYDDPSPNALSMAALICGILSLLAICIGGAIIPAALGILFALLSRKTRMCGQAKVGFFISIGTIGLYVLSFLIFIGALAFTGLLGPITDMALKTDITNAASVAEFQEETIRLFDERFGALLGEQSSRFSESLDSRGEEASALSDAPSADSAATTSVSSAYSAAAPALLFDKWKAASQNTVGEVTMFGTPPRQGTHRAKCAPDSFQ